MNSNDPSVRMSPSHETSGRVDTNGKPTLPTDVTSSAVASSAVASSPSQPAQQQQSSAFLPEPFPVASTGNANTKRHFHDAFGDESDGGVDYGPPNDCEDESCDDGTDDGTNSTDDVISVGDGDGDGDDVVGVEDVNEGSEAGRTMMNGPTNNLSEGGNNELNFGHGFGGIPIGMESNEPAMEPAAVAVDTKEEKVALVLANSATSTADTNNRTMMSSTTMSSDRIKTTTTTTTIEAAVQNDLKKSMTNAVEHNAVEQYAVNSSSIHSSIQPSSATTATAVAATAVVPPITAPPATASIATPTAPSSERRVIPIQELEEEVGLHETTLESLFLKLTKLDADIAVERTLAASLRDNVGGLERRRVAYERRTEENSKLARGVEISLGKCLERLAKALEASEGTDDGNGTANGTVGRSEGQNGRQQRSLEGGDAGDAGDATAATARDVIPKEVSTASTKIVIARNQIPSEDTDPSVQLPMTADTAVNLQDIQRQVQQRGQQHSPNNTTEQRACIIDSIPLHQISRGHIAWPSSKLARRIQTSTDQLPCYLPAWRIPPLSNPLLRAMDSASLIETAMNVTVLEHRMEMEDESKGKRGGSRRKPGKDGWVRETTDVWGTVLDAYAQVDWEHVVSGLGRAERGGTRGSADDVDATADVAAGDAAHAINPNAVLCPYELGGTCADDRCPYQHLKKRDSETDETTSVVKTPSWEGGGGGCGGGDGRSCNDEYNVEDCIVGYNNLPKLVLPRTLTERDFIEMEVEEDEEGGGTKVAMMEDGREANINSTRAFGEDVISTEKKTRSKEGEEHMERSPPSSSLEEKERLYHCPACVAETTYTQEGLTSHLSECNLNPSMSSNNNNDTPVTIRHVLRNKLEAESDDNDDDAAASLSSRGSDDNSAILRDDSPTNDESEVESGSVVVDGDASFELLNKNNEEGYDDDASIAASSVGSGTSNTTGDDDHHSMGVEDTVEDHETPPSEQPLPCGVKDNLDYVSLPSVADDSTVDECDMSHSDNHGGIAKDEQKPILKGKFWWQRHCSFSARPNIIVEGGRRGTTFDNLLSAFGFQRLCTSERDGTKDGTRVQQQWSLQWTSSLPPGIRASKQQQHIIDDDNEESILLFSRLVDCSRVCVHMGHDSFALSAISGMLCQSRISNVDANDPPYGVLLEGASRSIQSLGHSRCALSVFRVQVHLLLVSECLRALHESRCDGNTGGGSVGAGLLRLDDALVDRISQSDNLEQFAEKDLLPEGFVCERLTSRLPSAIRDTLRADDDGNDDEWGAFVRTLRLTVEKFVVLPYSQLETNQQISFLVQCACIGEYLRRLLRNSASKERDFSSYLHALEPIWSSLQALLQASGFNGWLQPDFIVIVIIGPVIFACVADTIALPADSASSQNKPPKFDSRALANISSLDTFIVGILKELNRYGRRSDGRFAESLITPLYALSASICVAVGSFQRAHQRLSNLLVGSRAKEDTMYALSEMIWSQLVQIRMVCPSYSVPLMIKDSNNSTRLDKPTLPAEILGTHNEIASHVAENGIFLWGVKLRGDSHMDIMSPCVNQMHCKEWEKAAKNIFEEHPLREADGPGAEQTLSKVEFHISDPYPELDGVKGRSSVFPESLFILGKTLTCLSLEKCGLTRLPFSIGHHLTHLQSLNVSNNHLNELPSSICLMAKLEVLNLSNNRLEKIPKLLSQCSNLRVIDVSHNQLTSFPANLALQCHNLHSFLVDGNPASDVRSPSQKRQKVGTIADDSLR